MKKVILWSLIVAFLITATTVLMIFIAKGYSFVDNQLISTGIIDVDSDPDGATIILDGKNVGTTPKQITRIPEGEHQLEIQKDGFTSWKKTIKMESGKVTTLSIKLFNTKLNLVQITDTNINQAYLSDNADVAIYTVTDNRFNTGIWRVKFNKSIFDFSDKDIEKIANIDLIPEKYLKDNSYSFEISKDSKSAVLILHDTPDYYYVFTDLNLRYNSLPISLNDELGYNPSNVEWNDDSTNLILSESNMLSIYDLKAKTIYLSQYRNTDSRIISSTNSDGTTLIYKNTLTEPDQLQTDNTRNILNFTIDNTKDKENLSIIISEKNTESIKPEKLILTNTEKTSFVFENANGIYYANTQAVFAKRIVDKGQLISLSPNGSALLYSLNNEIRTIEIDYDIVSNTIRFNDSKIEKKSNESVLKWYSFNDSILEYDPNTKELSIFDIDGGNRQVLLTNIILRNPQNDFVVNADKKELILNLEEEKTDAPGGSSSKNLYRLKL